MTGSGCFPALCSLIIPGLGQLLQGRPLVAFIFFLIAVTLWFFYWGWLVHIIAASEASAWRIRQSY